MDCLGIWFFLSEEQEVEEVSLVLVFPLYLIHIGPEEEVFLVHLFSLYLLFVCFACSDSFISLSVYDFVIRGQ